MANLRQNVCRHDDEDGIKVAITCPIAKTERDPNKRRVVRLTEKHQPLFVSLLVAYLSLRNVFDRSLKQALRDKQFSISDQSADKYLFTPSNSRGKDTNVRVFNESQPPSRGFTERGLMNIADALRVPHVACTVQSN